MRARGARRLVAGAVVCLALSTATEGVAHASSAPPPAAWRGSLNEQTMQALRALSMRPGPTSPPSAAFVVDAPPVTANGPEPSYTTTQSGRTLTVAGQHWTPGATVRLTNLSLASTSGDQRAAQPWDGQLNGELDPAFLCPLTSAPGHQLRCDAAAAFDEMAAAFVADTGRPLRLTDSYRTLAVQVSLKETKPDLAATPGRSNHGYGLAVDLADRAGDPSTPSGLWLLANAPTYGWVLPTWARPEGAKPEPWHWEYTGGPPRASATQVAADGTFVIEVTHLRGGANEMLLEVADQRYALSATGTRP